MANYTFVSDIVADALFRAGEVPNATSEYYTQAFTYLNNVYMQVCRGGSELDPSVNEDWSWLRKPRPGVIILDPPIENIGFNVTRGSATAGLTAIPTNYAGVNISLADWQVRIGDSPDIYTITAHNAGNNVCTLDSDWLGVTTVAAKAFVFAVDYPLASDVLRLVGPMRVFRNAGWNSRDDYRIYRADQTTMEDAFPLALTERGVPDLFAPIGDDPQNIKRVRFNRCGGGLENNTPTRIEYDYLIVPGDLTAPGTAQEPLVPREFRHMLASYLLAYLYGIKNDERSSSAVVAAQRALHGMKKEFRHKMTTATGNYFRLKARDDYYAKRGPRRTESGHII